jgi:hypothetical protein
MLVRYIENTNILWLLQIVNLKNTDKHLCAVKDSGSAHPAEPLLGNKKAEVAR